jgi:hypothetical protein
MSGTVRITVVDGVGVQRQIPGSRTGRPPSDDRRPVGRSTQNVCDHETGTRGGGLRHGPDLVLHGHASHRTRHFFPYTQHFDPRWSTTETRAPPDPVAQTHSYVNGR